VYGVVLVGRRRAGPGQLDRGGDGRQHAGIGLARRPQRELAEAVDPAGRRAELIDEYTERYANPYIAAERGYIDDVISPADTRAVINRSLDILSSKREELPRRKHGNVPL